MANSEWGTKRTCQSCGDPFYDLNKKNIECPKCGAAFTPAPPAKSRRPTPTPAAPKPVAVNPPKSAEDNGETKRLDDGADPVETPAPDNNEAAAGDKGQYDNLVVAEDDVDTLIEDTSDLGAEDDDMSEVKEHIDDGVEDKN